ncbi:MAG: hypothetical protein H6738_17890 [Alphaproteobacteria bacterium]|nr:hypothetical protein [Alphaproteobacteria bacterium]MCB9698658.1 hypothetical protein [Alphaproteobacteria bacterium]
MIRRQIGPSLAAMVLVLPAIVCTGALVNANRAADRIIATENTPLLQQVGERMKDLPHDEAEALVQDCMSRTLHCDPTDGSCVARLFEKDGGPISDEVAHDRAEVLLCIDRKLDGQPALTHGPDPEPIRRGPNRGETSTAGAIFAAETEEERGPSNALLAAGAIGGVVFALGALGAFFLFARKDELDAS